MIHRLYSTHADCSSFIRRTPKCGGPPVGVYTKSTIDSDYEIGAGYNLTPVKNLPSPSDFCFNFCYMSFYRVFINEWNKVGMHQQAIFSSHIIK